MSVRTRLGLAMIAMLTAIWISATSVRHWVPDHGLGITLLLLAPVIACGLAAIGLSFEFLQVSHAGGEIVHWFSIEKVALTLQIAGLLLLSYRALWMFFSWDGMFYFPVWLLLAAAVLCRWRPRWVPCA